jgi:hypothetical protein
VDVFLDIRAWPAAGCGAGRTGAGRSGPPALLCLDGLPLPTLHLGYAVPLGGDVAPASPRSQQERARRPPRIHHFSLAPHGTQLIIVNCQFRHRLHSACRVADPGPWRLLRATHK